MKISIITVCFNAAKTIREAMESVWAQRLAVGDLGVDGSRSRTVDVEYIVVDGGSTDGTVEIIKEFETHYCTPTPSTYTFRWLSEKDSGMYDALNKGIKMATGDVIGILNADDCLDGENVIARVSDYIEKVGGESRWTAEAPLDCVYGNVRFVEGEGLGSVDGRKTRRVCFARFWRPWMLQWGYMPPHPGIFIRKECFEKWGYYEPDRKEYRIAADYELLIRFFRVHQMKARYMPICTTVMRTGGVSTKDVEARKKLNEEIVKGNRVNGYFCIFPMLLPKYFVKIWEVILPRLGVIK